MAGKRPCFYEKRGDIRPTTNSLMSCPATSTVDDDISSHQQQQLLSVAYGGGSLGAALYDFSTLTVHLLSDTADSPPFFKQLTCLINQTQPDQVVTSGRQDERLLRHLKQMFEIDLTQDSGTPAIQVHFVSAGDYRADSCRHRVMAIKLPTDMSADETEHQSFLYAHIDFSQTSMIRSLGGLLRFLDRNPLSSSMAHQHIRRVKTLTLSDIMFVSRQTFQNLQIFTNILHPSSYKAETMKEGLSLFGILNKCASPVGVMQLRKMLLQPLKCQHKLEQRLDAVEFFTLHENQDIVERFVMNLRQMRPLQPLLHRMCDWHPLSTDWARLNVSLTSAVSVIQTCGELDVDINIIRRAANNSVSRVCDLIHTLKNTVNFSETRQLGRFSVQLGIDSQLDQWKHIYGDMSDMLEENLRVCQPELPEVVDVSSLSFFPMIGFVVMVESWSVELTDEQKMNIEGFDFQFSDDDRFFYKCQHCRRLDTEVGDFSLAISDRETSIQQQLIKLTIDVSEEIQEMLELCGEIDAVLSLSRAAVEFNYCRPRFHTATADGRGDSIQLVDSRHPLLELTTTDVVTNKFSSGLPDHCDRVKIITGANGSGKSIYMKQVALCVFMAQVGSFVAASSACLSVQNALVTVMPTRNTATGQQSGFIHELCQLNSALHLHNSTSTASPLSKSSRMFVLDELGAGTVAEDGTALLGAVLTHLITDSTNGDHSSSSLETVSRRRLSYCPHVLVSTHAHSLLKLLPPSQLITPLTSSTIQDPHTAQITYLYHIEPGVATAGSRALEAAASVHMPQQVLIRAHQVLQCLLATEQPAVEETLRQMMSVVMDRQCVLVETFLSCDLEQDSIQDILKRLETISHTESNRPTIYESKSTIDT